MIALDTNILIRYLTKDNPKQAEHVKDFLKELHDAGDQVFVNRIVLCELVWVLAGYDYSREAIAEALEKLIRTSQFIIEDSGVVWEAICSYRTTKVDFADILLGKTNTHAGYAKTVTFDKEAAKLNEFELLAAN